MLRGFKPVPYTADDLAPTTKWYSDVLVPAPYFNRRDYFEFGMGISHLALGILDRRYLGELGGLQSSETAPAGVIAYWHVDDVPATLDRLLSMGAKQHQPPRDFGEGFIGASVIDPFGNILGVMHNPHYLDVLGRIPAFELPEIKPVVVPDSG